MPDTLPSCFRLQCAGPEHRETWAFADVFFMGCQGYVQLIWNGVEYGQDGVERRRDGCLTRKGFDDFARGCMKHVGFDLDARSHNVVTPAYNQVDVQFLCEVRGTYRRVSEFVAQIFFVNGMYFGRMVIGVDIPFDNGCREPVPLGSRPLCFHVAIRRCSIGRERARGAG